MLKIFISCILIAFLHNAEGSPQVEIYRRAHPVRIKTFELFTILIEPELFNWTTSYQPTEQFRYRPMLKDKPTIPSWMTFETTKESNIGNNGNTGFIYGTAPKKYANKRFELEIVGLNRNTYETRVAIVTFEVMDKKQPANRVEMKISNMNWYHMTDLTRIDNLKDVFFGNLWPQSAIDLKILFMQSAVKMGSRMPSKPHQREGVVVVIGSNSALSKRLRELDDEVRPLKKLSTCTFKKTKVQSVFQNAGFIIDWCGFKIMEDEQSEVSSESSAEEASFTAQKTWNAPSKEELPIRNYSEEIAISVAIPSVVFAFLVGLLTVTLCFQHDKLIDDELERKFDELFTLCNPMRGSDEERKPSQPVQMVQYSDSTKSPPVVTTLKSLHEPYDDNLSFGSSSQSPTSGIFRGSLTKLNAPTYFRPNPPAYRAPKMGESSGMMYHQGGL